MTTPSYSPIVDNVLVQALKDIIEYEPERVAPSPSEELEIQSCEECKSARDRKWPPSGMCDKHYTLVSGYPNIRIPY